MRTKLLVMLALLAVSLPAHPYDFAVDGIYYSFTSDGQAVTVSGGSAKDIVIPNEISYSGISYPVVAIDTKAFKGNTSISTITLGDNVTEIGEEAFYECKSLGYDQGGAYTLNLNKVKIIGARAFYLCGINYYSSHYNGRLTEVIITPSVEIIGDGAFSSCANLTTINFMAGTRTVGRMAFSNCSSLTTINFEEGAKFKSLGADAFSNTVWYNNKPGGIVYLGKYFYAYKGAMPNNTNIILDEGTLGIAPKAFFEKSGLISVSIPSSVEFIGTSAFNGCTGLTSITIPESVNSIDSYAFSGCTSLENVTLPSSISNINNNTFSGCTSLNNITIPETVTTLGNAAFSSSGLTSVAIPNSVTSMGDGVFMNCSGLKSATLPASISNIETNTFNGCSGLTTITIPSSVKTINAGAFSGCTGLTKLTLSYSLETIANTAFNGCSNIKTLTFDASKLTDYSSLNPLTAVETLTFGSHIKSIPASLISQFSSLKNVTLGSAITAIDDNVFMGKKSLETIDLKSVKTIGNHAFDGCSGLTAITFPNTVIGMGDYVLNECTGLQTVTLPAAMSEVSRGMFYGCTALTSIALPETVTVIKPLAFASSGLTSISLPASMTQVSDSVFWNCTSLAAATMPSNLESVGARAFSKTALTAVTLPAKVSSIGAGAFQQCNSLKNAKLPNSVKIVSGYLFEGCSALESVTLGNAVTDIQNYAFSGTALTQITLPATLISIGESAFRSCTGCVSISIPNKVTTIGDNAFRDCSALTSVTIGNSVVSIGKYAFAGCTGLTNLTIPANVATVGNYAFNGCNGVKTLNYRAKALETPANLSGMNNVETVNFDGAATVVPANLLPNYPKLALVNVGKDVANIAEGAFDNCDALKTMNYDAANCASGQLAITTLDTLAIGSNVKNLADRAFYNCTNLKKITSKATTPPTLGGYYVFPPNTYIGVPATVGATYKNKWSSIASEGYTRVLPLPIYRFDSGTGFLANGNPFVTTNAIIESNAECSDAGFILVDQTAANGVKTKINSIISYFDNRIYFRNLQLNEYVLPGHRYWIYPYIVVNGVEYDGFYYAEMEIPALQSAYQSNVGPSSIILTDDTAIPENINFTSATFTLDNKTYESYGNDIIVTGLKPNKWYYGNYSVAVNEGDVNSTNINFRTPALTLNTQPVKMLTNTAARLEAYTNLSEEETSCGFLWKRYDAPESMLGNPVYCPVYEGTMTGTLKNLPEGVYYQYRAFYRDSEGKLYYGDDSWVAFYTGDATVEFEPVAHTYDNARVSGANAIIQGVALRGSKDITEQGFEYWVDGAAQSEALMAPSTVNKVTATGERMTSTLTGLKGNAIYSFRAYVKTADGTTYGEVRTFRTPVTAMPGDVNGDQVISGADVTALYNVLLDGSTAGGDADVNGDGVVSGADVTALYNLLLN